ncbi:MAG TPA: polysaccharide biosynthesis tyrosine autokinase [Gemmataceae bacterium]|nr:polysaccharide biosynthesis tyrosine autokinase [Gemmataceae bacterium]
MSLWFLLPLPKQMVRSLLFVSSKDPYILFPRNDGYSFDMYQRSQIAAVKSRFVISAALKQRDPDTIANLAIIQEKPDPIQWLEKELQVDFSVSPEQMRISLRGDNTGEMKLLVNAVTKAYLTEFVDREKNKRLDRLEQLKRAFSKIDEQKQKKKGNLDAVIKTAGTGDSHLLLFKQQMALQQLSMAKNELADIRTQVRRLQVKIASQMMQDRRGEDLALALYCQPPLAFPPTGTVSMAIAGILMRERAQESQIPAFVKEQVEDLIRTDPEFRKYVKRENELTNLIAALHKVNPPDAPKEPVLANEEELTKVRATMETKRKEIRPKYLDRILREAKMNSTSSLAQLQVEKNYLLLLEKNVESDVEQFVKDDQFLNKSNLDLESMKDELARTEIYWKKVAGEIDNLEVEQAAPSRISQLEEAIIADPGHSTTRLGMIGLGGLGSLALVCLGFGFWEFRAQRVNSPSQLVQVTGMQLMGTLPDYTRIAQSRKTSVEGYDGILSDSVDAMRTLLLFISKMEGIRTVLVTSAVAGEGKTFSACQLAASLARSGRKTLLLDCDIRNPTVHNAFELEYLVGLCEVLREECNLAEAIHSCSVDNLFIMPAGQADVLALRLLALDKTAVVFSALKNQFDFIVVDSSPVLPVPDALVIAHHTDAAVLSILRDVSQYPKVHSAYQLLGSLGIRILGAIFNGSKDESSAMYSYVLPRKKIQHDFPK